MPQQIILQGKALYQLPCRANKRPTTANGLYDAVADQAAIEQLWRNRWGPLTGVRTGQLNGISLIDVDPRRNGNQWYEQHRHQLPLTRIHQTQSDGPLLQSDAALRTENDGPPLMNRVTIPKGLYFAVREMVPLSEKVTRHHQRRVNGILSIVTRRSEKRNNGLNIAAYCLRELVAGGIVGREVAKELLLEAATKCGYVAKDGVEAAIRTIRSGLGIGSFNSGPSLSPDKAAS